MKRIKAQMEAGSSSKRVEEAPDRNVYILQAPEESPKKESHTRMFGVYPLVRRIRQSLQERYDPGGRVRGDSHSEGHGLRLEECGSRIPADGEQDLLCPGRNMEIYMDDMLIKSREARDQEANLRKSFENLRKYNRRLNPDKNFDMMYKQRMSIKAQELADFVVECTHKPVEEAPELINLKEASHKRV
ncbi:hypothetical protein LIER_36608 [Lithospermum erythrorhizon]|uniref:Uncharacterized protein n=1 Tax=Lithospermum erythrorhizon TaxID=34254 RepID=A0AAV3P9L8_LITER